MHQTALRTSVVAVSLLLAGAMGAAAAEGFCAGAADFDNRARTLYAIDNFGATLGTIDLATGPTCPTGR